MSDLHSQAKSIFLESLQVDSATVRRELIDRKCGADVSLRREVERLMGHRKAAEPFLESPPPGIGELDTADQAEVPTNIGPYRIREQIGEGGMGVVYVAEQTTPVQRKVAIKIIKPGMDTKEVIARFEAERQALAFMEHPNIARVLDAGATESGRSYFVMELVRGIPITEYCDQVTATPRERLELFQTVCDAVQHAHQKGIIHRDIKPSNVLVTQVSAKPVVKVIDFGLAKATSGQRLTDKTLYTGFMRLMGTPAYMSPEQAGLSGLDIDTRSDIYSLGVLLYELLTGTTPLDKTEIQQQAYEDLCRQIREVEAPRPSTRLSTLNDAQRNTVAQNRLIAPKSLGQLLDGDLDCVVLQAIEKDRDRRYASPQDLAADVGRFLQDEPVLAMPPSQWYVARKYMRRHKVAILTATTLLLSLILATGFSTWQRNLARRAERNAIVEKQIAIDAQEQSLAEKRRAELAKQEAEAARKQTQRTSRERRLLLYASNMQLADQLWRSPKGTLQDVEDLLVNWIPTDEAPDLREFAWRYQWTRLHHSGMLSFENVRSIAMSPGGALMMLRKEGVSQWSEENQDLLPKLNGDFQKLSPGGRWATQTQLDSINVIDLSTGDVRINATGNRCRFSTDGNFAVIWTSDNESQLRNFQRWNISEGKRETWPFDIPTELRKMIKGRVGPVGLRGESIFLFSRHGCLSLVRELSRPMTWDRYRALYAAAWSPDGQFVAVGDDAGIVHLRCARDWDHSLPLSTNCMTATAVAFSPDSTKLAVGGEGKIEIWDVSGYGWQGSASSKKGGEPSTEGTRRVSEGSEPAQTRHEFRLKPNRIQTIKSHRDYLSAIEISRDGSKLATLSGSGVARLWNLDRDAAAYPVNDGAPDLYDSQVGIEFVDRPQGVVVNRIDPQRHDVLRGQVSVGDQIVGLTDDRGYREVGPLMNWYDVRRMTMGPMSTILKLHLKSSPDSHERIVELKRTYTRPPESASLQFSPDGKSIAVAERKRGAVMLTAGGRHQHRYPALPSSVAISPDGNLLAMDDFKELVLWDLSKHQQVARLRIHVEAAVGTSNYGRPWGTLAFSPDGRFIAMGTGYRGNVAPKRSDLRVWDVVNKRWVGDGPLFEADRVFSAVCFTPDSASLLAARHDGVVQIWDTSSWAIQRTLHRPNQWTTSLEISPDGRSVAQAGKDPAGTGGLILWDLESGELLHRLPAAHIYSVSISPDGKSLASTDVEKKTDLWDLASGMRLMTLLGHEMVASGCDFSPDGNLLATVDHVSNLRLWEAKSLEQIDQHPITIDAITRRATHQLRDGQYEDAETSIRSVLRRQRSSLAENHPNVVGTTRLLVESLKAQGNVPAVVPLVSRVQLGSRTGFRIEVANSDDNDWTYQWFHAGEGIEGETRTTLTIDNVSQQKLGRYHVQMKSGSGNDALVVTSNDVFLVDDANPIVKGLRKEFFGNIATTAERSTLSELTDWHRFPHDPDNVDLIGRFETPSNAGDRSDHSSWTGGLRISGFLMPPKSGDYTFYLCSDSRSQLFLSSDESPENKEPIAIVNQRHKRDSWETLKSENVSAPISLKAGKRYWIEAHFVEGIFDDHFAVTWQMPDKPPPENGDPPIPGEYLEYRLD